MFSYGPRDLYGPEDILNISALAWFFLRDFDGEVSAMDKLVAYSDHPCYFC